MPQRRAPAKINLGLHVVRRRDDGYHDIETVFLFPWAVAYGQLSWFGFAAGFLFIFLLTDALIYAWRKDALEWV